MFDTRSRMRRCLAFACSGLRLRFAPDSVTVDPWSQNAVDHRGQDGNVYSLDCPAGGDPHSIWGTETYTDDSSICTAAVQVGLPFIGS